MYKVGNCRPFFDSLIEVLAAKRHLVSNKNDVDNFLNRVWLSINIYN